MAIVRVKEGIQCATFDHRIQSYVTLVGGIEFDSGDPFVKENAWAFETDDEAEARGSRKSKARVTSVEMATANPGELRNR